MKKLFLCSLFFFIQIMFCFSKDLSNIKPIEYTHTIKDTNLDFAQAKVWVSDTDFSMKHKQDDSTSSAIKNYFTQPLFVSENYTGIEGKIVDIKDVLDDVEDILEGKYDDIDEEEDDI